MYILKILTLICLILILNCLLKDNREHFESKTLHGIPKVIYQTYNKVISYDKLHKQNRVTKYRKIKPNNTSFTKTN